MTDTTKSDPAAEAAAQDISNSCPDKKTLEEVENVPVQDSEGKEHKFGEIYSWPEERGKKRRVVVIFVRHFFCGNCQEYLKAIDSSIGSPSSLPAQTKLVIIGCGAATLIPMYTQESSCSFPIYTDPTKRLYSSLGMTKSMSMGQSPDYIKSSAFTSAIRGISQGLKRISQGDVLKGGDTSQIGGEFLFETTDDDQGHSTTEVTWCHRMKNTRDHVEIPELRRILGLESNE